MSSVAVVVVVRSAAVRDVALLGGEARRCAAIGLACAAADMLALPVPRGGAIEGDWVIGIISSKWSNRAVATRRRCCCAVPHPHLGGAVLEGAKKARSFDPIVATSSQLIGFPEGCAASNAVTVLRWWSSFCWSTLARSLMRSSSSVLWTTFRDMAFTIAACGLPHTCGCAAGSCAKYVATHNGFVTVPIAMAVIEARGMEMTVAVDHLFTE